MTRGSPCHIAAPCLQAGMPGIQRARCMIFIPVARPGMGSGDGLIPIRSAKLCGALTHEKHRGGLPCGWGHEAPKERLYAHGET